MPTNRLPKKGLVDSVIYLNEQYNRVNRQLCCMEEGVGDVTSFNGRTGAVTLSSADVNTALGYTPYNGTTNPNGYVTSAQLALKANIASPTFTGTPSAPTAAVATNTTQLATTAFVHAAIAANPVPVLTLEQVVNAGNSLSNPKTIFFKDPANTNNVGLLRSTTTSFNIEAGGSYDIIIMPTSGNVRIVDSNPSGTGQLSLEMYVNLPAGANTPVDATTTWNQAIANLQTQITTRTLAHIDPATGTAQDVINALIAAGLMAP